MSHPNIMQVIMGNKINFSTINFELSQINLALLILPFLLCVMTLSNSFRSVWTLYWYLLMELSASSVFSKVGLGSGVLQYVAIISGELFCLKVMYTK